MARIQTLRSSLLVLRARNSSGCARSRATRPRPRGRAPAHGARPAPGCPAPGPAEWSPPRRPGTSRRRCHLAGRARSTRERAPLGTPERGVVLVLPGRDRRGAPTEVSVGCLRVDQCLEHPDLAAKSLRLRRRPTSRCVQPFWARQAASRASSPSGTQPARTWAVASHRLRTLPSVRTRHRGSRLEAPRSSAPRCPAHSEQVGAEVPQPWL